MNTAASDQEEIVQRSGETVSEKISFPHRQSAHCESGVTANFLHFYGRECSEAMAFGLGEGLFFAYLPFIRINKLPLTTYRSFVGTILKKTMRCYGVSLKREKFANPQEAEADLNEKLAAGIPVGCQTGVYWLPYFPPALRFHFNAHNIVIYGREGDEYLVSDPVFSYVNRITAQDLQRARYARGALAPVGSRYYIERVGELPDQEQTLRKAIRHVCKSMTALPLQPCIGTSSIHFLAGRIEKWPKALGEDQAILHLGHLIRMQEEIGTGGGGFRFMYAAFLQEAADAVHAPMLREFSERLTIIGASRGEIAVSGSRLCKQRPEEEDSFTGIAAKLRQCGREEHQFFLDLNRAL